MNTVPLRLAAPSPTWTRDVDVVVLGSGAAGLAAALAVRPVRSVLIVTKDVLNAGSTAWAQGGLAGVLHPTDSFEHHVRDTLAAGAGLCDEAVVRELVAEAPTSIRYLMRLGAAFDPDAEGEGPALTREGGHSHHRIVHSGGDRSGAEVQRTLDESAMAAGVDVLERAFALDLVTGTGADGVRQAAGVTVALRQRRRSARVRRPDHGPRRRAGDGRLRADLRVDLEPSRGHRRRRRHRHARRAGGPRRRVRAVPSDRDLDEALTPPASRRSSARPCAARGRSSTTPPASG